MTNTAPDYYGPPWYPTPEGCDWVIWAHHGIDYALDHLFTVTPDFEARQVCKGDTAVAHDSTKLIPHDGGNGVCKACLVLNLMARVDLLERTYDALAGHCANLHHQFLDVRNTLGPKAAAFDRLFRDLGIDTRKAA